MSFTKLFFADFPIKVKVDLPQQPLIFFAFSFLASPSPFSILVHLRGKKIEKLIQI